MIRPRLSKILTDLWGNKIRSLLVIASIAVGLLAVGIIATLHAVLSADMRRGYIAIQPANIQIVTDPFDQDLVDEIKHTEGVLDAAGERTASLRLYAGKDGWIQVNLKSVPDSGVMTIDVPKLVEGKWPPSKQEIVLEHYKLPDTNAKINDIVQIELPSGKTRPLKLVGSVEDQSVGASGIGGGFFLAPLQGYVTLDTMDWLEQTDTYNQIYVRVQGDGNDSKHITAVSDEIRKTIENSGRSIINKVLRRTDEHPTSSYVDALSGVLFLLGFLVVFLSAFLITNTLSALMNQQVQQIGIMKTVGAQRFQVISIYMLLISIFGLLAFIIALPLSQFGSFRLLEFLSEKINFSLFGWRLVPTSVILQVVIALIVPQVAGFVPILRGSGITVQEALSGFAQGGGTEHESPFFRRLLRIRRLSRPLLISLRNTFRRRIRLILTLITLSLGGAIFIGTFNVQESLTRYIQQVGKYFLADVNLSLDEPYRIERVQQELGDMPEIKIVEGWAAARTELVLEDGTVGDSFTLFGPPADSKLVKAILLSGRWIKPGDQDAIALSERFLSRFPEKKVGDTIRLRVNGKKRDWKIVGFFQLAGKSGGYLAYTDYDTLAHLLGQPNHASQFRIVARRTNLTADEQKQLGRKVEEHLKASNIRVTDVTAGQSLQTSASKGLDILTAFLLFMALLIALVGSIGLMGTMSMNVMERTREIGVMRAIGATNNILIQLVIVEGMLIGLISWIAGSLLAFPISNMMSDTISQAIFDAPSNFSYTPLGFIIWLGLVIILSILASVLPARNAARLTIREVLAYE